MRYNIEFIPLVPIHIGTGRDVGLLEYTVIREKEKNGYCYVRFSTDRAISQMEDEQKKLFLQNIEGGDLKKLIGVLSCVVKPEAVLYRLRTSESFCGEYFAKKEKIETQLIVQDMYRHPVTFVPMIPGSSLKGCLRTAIVNWKSKDKKLWPPPDKSFENDVLKYRDAKSDPFRAVRISDCMITGENVELVAQVFNFKADFMSMHIFQEQLQGVLSGGNCIGQCEFTIDDNLLAIQNPIGYGKNEWKPLSVKINVQEIITACNSFYKKNLENEYNRFYRSCNYQPLKETADGLNRCVATIKAEDMECLVRIGRHSHIENVTDANYRKPKVSKYGSTRFISEKRYPMGWAKLKFTEVH
jgi:CRISPR-associated protein Csm5